MRTLLVCLSLFALSVTLVSAAPAQEAARPAAAATEVQQVLLLTGGAIHDHKGVGDVVQGHLEAAPRFNVTRVEQDLDAFKRLDNYDTVIFYWTVGEIADDQLQALLTWVENGGRFVTFHSGADSFRGSPEYRQLVGGFFVTHPAYRPYQVSVTDPSHPVFGDLGDFIVTDEQYVVQYWPEKINVLANGLWKGKLMPVAWERPYGDGAVLYFGFGHDARAVQQPIVKKIILRSAAWATGLLD